MYDFILLTPHGSASNSVVSYLNQHPSLNVAPHAVVQRSLADITAFERLLRPWIKVVGIMAKDYATPSISQTILSAAPRSNLVQRVRDPVEHLISLCRSNQMVAALSQNLGKPAPQAPVDEFIATAVEKYITPNKAANAYEAHTFKSHIVIDVSALRGAGSESTIKELWKFFSVPHEIQNTKFKPLGSAPYHMLREFANHFVSFGNLEFHLAARLDGDLPWSITLNNSSFYGYEARLHSFPDARAIFPNGEVSEPLHIWAPGVSWSALPPSVRLPFAQKHVTAFVERLKLFNDAFGKAKKLVTFTADDLTPTQREALKSGIGGDVDAFVKKHPTATAAWKTTKQFLGN